MPTKLILIRHGETAWNVEQRFQGQGAIPLNENGKNQADRLGQFFAKKPAGEQRIYCSDSIRTRQTAEIFNKYLNLPISYDARLREIDVGQWQGMNMAEVDAWDPERRKAFLEDPYTNGCPDGENYTQVATRGAEVLNEIAQKHPDEKLLIVSHGALIRHTVKRLIPTAMADGPILNTSLTALMYDEANGWQIVCYSLTPHLLMPQD